MIKLFLTVSILKTGTAVKILLTLRTFIFSWTLTHQHLNNA